MPAALAAVPAGRLVAHLGGFPDLAVLLEPAPTPADRARFERRLGGTVYAEFPEGQTLRLRLVALHEGRVVEAPGATPAVPGALDLVPGRPGAAPLWLHPDGRLSARPDGVDEGPAAERALVTAARWISGRRTASFERLFPPDPFHPELAARTERLSLDQGRNLAAWVQGLVSAPGASDNLRSACVTILAHVVATGGRDRDWRELGSSAVAFLLAWADQEPRSQLRGHLLQLLQLRGPALSKAHRDEVVRRLHALVRAAPPYEELPPDWAFAMCSAWDFHEGECETLVRTHQFTEVLPAPRFPSPPAGFGKGYRVFEAPFRTPKGGHVRVYARAASPADENGEMGMEAFVGVLVNRHAQLGAHDMKAASVQVEQHGYKLMMNSQCAGLTTRFALTRLFPDADVYSSWDSTYFRTDRGGGSGKLIASEGLDCFVAVLRGMAEEEDHAALSERIRDAQWSHEQSWADQGFVQFIGPSHPAVIARFDDVNRDGRADVYDGFLDFELAAIVEDIEASATPRDPGVAASAVSGAAADGLNWAAGSMNRVVQYSDLWAGLPDRVELLYAFQSAGFYSTQEPLDGIGGRAEDHARLPALVRYPPPGTRADFRAECALHAWLAHAGRELKRLLVAAEALNRAFDLGHLRSEGDLATPLGRRCMLLLTLAGLLDFPADQNRIDTLWSTALHMLRLPDVSRSSVRAHITEADHDASNYYGSKRGLRALMGAVKAGDPVVLARLSDADPSVGRAAPLPID